MVNIPPVSGSGPSPVGDSPGSIDNDTTFIQLYDAAWEAIAQFQDYPTDLNTQTAMQCINNLNAFLTANPPTQANNPDAYAIEQALSSGPPITSSLAEICANYGTGNCQQAVDYFESSNGDTAFNDLQGILDQFGSAKVDSGNATIEQDVDYLQSDLHMYNVYMQETNPDPQLLPGLLTAIAKDINKLDTDAQGANLTDGYLTILTTYLNTSLQAGGTVTLQSLSAAVLANDPPTTADLDALNTALQGLGEQSSMSGGALQALLQDSQREEY